MIGMQAASFPEVELAWVQERVGRFAAPAPRSRRTMRKDRKGAPSRRIGGVPLLRGRAVGGAA
jgi:hypothetical protein